MSHWLSALAALPEALGSIPRIHSGSQPSIILVPGNTMPSSGLHGHQEYTLCTDIHTCLFLLFNLRQGVSLNLKLGWQPASLRNPPVSAFSGIGLGMDFRLLRPSLAFMRPWVLSPSPDVWEANPFLTGPFPQPVFTLAENTPVFKCCLEYSCILSCPGVWWIRDDCSLIL